MNSRWVDSKVVDIVEETDSVRRIFLEYDEAFDFKAGQFIVTDLPIHEKRTQRWRSYSIANDYNKDGFIELCVVHLKGGLGSGYLCKELKIGDQITHKRPQGGFVLPKNSTRNMTWICTGTGIAPFRSMLHELIREEKFDQSIHLIFGTRKESDILYRKEMEDFQEKFSWFNYSVALSREPNWPHYGYVHPLYENLSSKEDLFYLCGWPVVVDERFLRLTEKMDVPKDQIRFEFYG